PQRQNPICVFADGVLRCKSLTMTYFHRRTSTIIGAKAFHGPVRDGKAWDHLAMVVKRKGLRCRACRLGHARHCQSGSEAQQCGRLCPGARYESRRLQASKQPAVIVYWVLWCCVLVFSGTCITLQPARLEDQAARAISTG